MLTTPKTISEPLRPFNRIMQHHVILSVSHPVTTNVTQFSVVRVDGAYTTGSPILGVVMEDASAGDLASVAVQGLVPVEIAAGQNVEVGDLLGLNAAGKGVEPTAGTKVSDFTTVIEIDQNHALVIV